MSTYSMTAKALALVALLSAPVSAFFRVPCPGRLVLERIDPVISPGKVSGHVHTVSGGSGLGFSTDYAQLRASACSSCPIKQDLSAYWTPKLYFQAADGHFEDVLQSGEGSGSTGGLTIYYLQRGPDLTKLKAFPEGFRMVAGDPFQRNYTGLQSAPGAAVSFACLNYNAPATAETNGFPTTNCPDGLRAQVFFPSCWDGVNLDSADHVSHMAYPIGQYNNGYCPASHPVQFISLFYEVVYSTGAFASRWPTTGVNPFVFAQGDKTGYGFHGDFVNGWNTTYLQQAVSTCTADSGNIADCPVFNGGLFTNAEAAACRLPNNVNEQITGSLPALAGCNPVTTGPAYASPPACAAGVIGAATQPFTDETKSNGWAYQGCAKDGVNGRTFKGASTSSGTMTVETCIAFCKGKGYSLAGLEYAGECFCDNTYTVASTAPIPNILGQCLMPCNGNSAQLCGGPNAMSVYKNCAGGACSNTVFNVNGTGLSSKTMRSLGQHVRDWTLNVLDS